MKLIFKKADHITVIPRDDAPEVFRRITGCSAMAMQSMRGGIPLVLDGGEYRIVNEDLSNIDVNNFL